MRVAAFGLLALVALIGFGLETLPAAGADTTFNVTLDPAPAP